MNDSYRLDLDDGSVKDADNAMVSRVYFGDANMAILHFNIDKIRARVFIALKNIALLDKFIALYPNAGIMHYANPRENQFIIKIEWDYLAYFSFNVIKGTITLVRITVATESHKNIKLHKEAVYKYNLLLNAVEYMGINAKPGIEDYPYVLKYNPKGRKKAYSDNPNIADNEL